MTTSTGIEWTEKTWNPTTGCDRVSPGCDHCYALTMAARLKAAGSPAYQTDGDPRTSGPGFGLALHEERLHAPFGWRKPTVVFVNSMSDLFHERVPLDFIQRVFEVMAATPQHTYQVLTKRSSRLLRLAGKLTWAPNVWMGVSVENQDYLIRAVRLAAVPAAVRFVSAEPLLGPIDLYRRIAYQGELHEAAAGIDWLIAGGESGPGARPCEIGWLRDLRDQCNALNINFFLKQLGGHPDKRGHEKARLDGRRWLEMPLPQLGRRRAGAPA